LQALEASLGFFLKDRWPSSKWLFRRIHAKERTLLFISASLLTLCNPNGIEVWLYPIRLNHFFYQSGVSFSLGIFHAPSPSTYPLFFFALALLLLAFLPFRQIKKLSLLEWIGSLFFLILALRSNRFIFHFVIFVWPLCLYLYNIRISELNEQGEEPEKEISSQAKILWIKYGVIVKEGVGLFVLLLAFIIVQPRFDYPTIPTKFPIYATKFIQKEKIKGRIFNYQNYGGYLIWFLRHPVFWDGRNLLFAPIVKELQSIRSFGTFLDRYRLEILILNRGTYKQVKTALSSKKKTWGLVFWDDAAAVYLRRLPRFQDILLKHEYHFLKAFGEGLNLSQIAKSPKLLAKVNREFKRALLANPVNPIALYSRGVLAFLNGESVMAKTYLLRAVKIRPYYQLYKALAVIFYKEGNRSKAKEYMQKAQALKGERSQ